MTALKGLIFDVDGTLGDTVALCIEAFRCALVPFKGRRYEDHEVTAHFGKTEEGISIALEPERWRELFEGYMDNYRRLYPSMVKSFPDIPPLLDWLQTKDIRLAVVTGKGPVSAAYTLEQLGVLKYFDAVEAGSREGPIKPVGMRTLVEMWKLKPSEVGYVGDSPYDMRASREAGLLALGAAWATTGQADALLAEKPDAVFKSVGEFREWLEQKLDRGTSTTG